MSDDATVAVTTAALAARLKIPDIPPSAYYVRDFITEEEEELLIRRINETPQPKWKNMTTGRRLQYWGGTMTKNGTLVPEPIPDFLTEIGRRVDECLRLAGRPLGINQVLINEYQPDQGIAPHEDGGAFEPLVATISLGSHTVLDIHHYLHPTEPSPPMIATPAPATSSTPDQSSDEASAPNTEGPARPIAAIPLAHILLQPRSLLILSDTLYQSHLHGIQGRTEDLLGNGEGREAVVNAELAGIAGKGTTGKTREGDADGQNGKIEQGEEWEWTGHRGIRTSLTFRRAKKVLKGGVFKMGSGGMRRQ